MKEAVISSALASYATGFNDGYITGKVDAVKVVMRTLGIPQANLPVANIDSTPNQDPPKFSKSIADYRAQIDAFYKAHRRARWSPFYEPLLLCMTDFPLLKCDRVGLYRPHPAVTKKR